MESILSLVIGETINCSPSKSYFKFKFKFKFIHPNMYTPQYREYRKHSDNLTLGTYCKGAVGKKGDTILSDTSVRNIREVPLICFL